MFIQLLSTALPLWAAHFSNLWICKRKLIKLGAYENPCVLGRWVQKGGLKMHLKRPLKRKVCFPTDTYWRVFVTIHSWIQDHTWGSLALLRKRTLWKFQAFRQHQGIALLHFLQEFGTWIHQIWTVVKDLPSCETILDGCNEGSKPSP